MPLSKIYPRHWFYAASFFLFLSFIQSPGKISADTKHDLTADPWGFLSQALSPWTDIFPFGQLQNQAYGYLFPQGFFFALTSPLPDWIAQRLWWAITLFLAYAGILKLLDILAVGSPLSRIIAALFYALSPRVLTTLGAISSETWAMALSPWILLPLVWALEPRTHNSSSSDSTGSSPPLSQKQLSKKQLALAALFSASALLMTGSVNAVATGAALLPAVLWWFSRLLRGPRPQVLFFSLIWIPAGIAATFWWIGPLLILGSYSPPFTDYIESSSITTRWLSPYEVLRGTTSWTPFISPERIAGHLLVIEPIFIAGSIILAALGLWGLKQRPPHAATWIIMTLLAFLIMCSATVPFAPYAVSLRDFLDHSGAALRNLHKFDPLIRIPLAVGCAQFLGHYLSPTTHTTAHPAQSKEKEQKEQRSPLLPRLLAILLLFVVLLSPALSGRLAAAGSYEEVPDYWKQTAHWLHENLGSTEGESSLTSSGRVLVVPESRFATQTWGNTRDEPLQPLANIPWVVRDSVPLVPPEAIRALDAIMRELSTEAPQPALPAILAQQGISTILVRTDLHSSADAPSPQKFMSTLRLSGLRQVAHFGHVYLYQYDLSSAYSSPSRQGSDSKGEEKEIGDWSLSPISDMEVIAGGPEVIPRLTSEDYAYSRLQEKSFQPRSRILASDIPESLSSLPTRVRTDTPTLREHNYGSVQGADSAIRSAEDPSNVLNAVKDYPVLSANREDYTSVYMNGGSIRTSSSADSPLSYGGAMTENSPSAAVDQDSETFWKPAPGIASGEWLEIDLPQPYPHIDVEFKGAGSATRWQLSGYHGDQLLGTTTFLSSPSKMTKVRVPMGTVDRVRFTILQSYGSTGIADVQLYDSSVDEENPTKLTPTRDITLPPASNSVQRWSFGQEIPEGTMQRIFELPSPTRVTFMSQRCARGYSPSTTKVELLDLKEKTIPLTDCGQSLMLEGKVRLISHERWVSLAATDSLAHSAHTQEPTLKAQTLSRDSSGSASMRIHNSTSKEAIAQGSTNAEYQEQKPLHKDSSSAWILSQPRSYNSGFRAYLTPDFSAPVSSYSESSSISEEGQGKERAGTRIELEPITVNGWQQGWIIPASYTGTVSIEFQPTSLYRWWLAIGAVLAFMLFLGTVLLLRTAGAQFLSPQSSPMANQAHPLHFLRILSRDNHTQARVQTQNHKIFFLPLSAITLRTMIPITALGLAFAWILSGAYGVLAIATVQSLYFLSHRYSLRYSITHEQSIPCEHVEEHSTEQTHTHLYQQEQGFQKLWRLLLSHLPAVVFFISIFSVLIAGTNHPWGSSSYAGDSWFTQIAVLLAIHAAFYGSLLPTLSDHDLSSSEPPVSSAKTE